MLLFMVSCEKESEIVPEIEYEEDVKDNPKKDRWDTYPHIISVDSTANCN